jgi:uncharacterized membrane protein
MSWQAIVILQIFVSSLMTLWTRHISLSSKKVFYTVGLVTYFTIASVGILISIIGNRGLPSVAFNNSFIFIVIAGIAIPIAWLFQYKLISYIGASNTTVVSTINTVGAATLGIVLLNEAISVSFIIGVLLIVAGVYLALNIRADKAHGLEASFYKKFLLVLGSFVFFSIGLFFEKQAITGIGVLDYAFYGWTMQFIGVLVIYLLFGRSEKIHTNPKIIKNSVYLGLFTSAAGGLFIIALSMGTLSHTIIATSGKIAITMLMSAIFLNERNDMRLRICAFVSAMLGIALILF